MREILFKAKRVDNGEWVEGSYVHRTQFYGEDCPCDDHFILSGGEFHCDYYDAQEIIPETLCEFTGLHDKNGKRIWENDIVRGLEYEPQVAVVKFGNGYYDGGIYPFVGWYYQYPNDENVDGQALYERVAREDFEVIGNIFDNGELFAERIGDNEN